MAGGDIISFGKKNLRNWIWFGKLISYHGRKKMKQCAVVLRLALTWYRFEFSSHLFRQLCTVFLCQNSFHQIFDNFVIGLAALRYWPGATRCQHLTNFALKQATRTSRWPVRQLIWPYSKLWKTPGIIPGGCWGDYGLMEAMQAANSISSGTIFLCCLDGEI